MPFVAVVLSISICKPASVLLDVLVPVLSKSILIPIYEYTRIYLGGTGGAVDLIFYGLNLMLICIFRPDGLISLLPKNILTRKKQK